MSQGNVPLSMSDTKGKPRSVFGIAEDTHPFTTRDETFDPSKGFGKTSKFRGVVAARSGSKKRLMPGITRNKAAQNSDKVVGRDGSNANSVPSARRLKPPSVKSLQPGNSIPVIPVAVRQASNVGKFSSAWRTGKFQV